MQSVVVLYGFVYMNAAFAWWSDSKVISVPGVFTWEKVLTIDNSPENVMLTKVYYDLETSLQVDISKISYTYQSSSLEASASLSGKASVGIVAFTTSNFCLGVACGSGSGKGSGSVVFHETFIRSVNDNVNLSFSSRIALELKFNKSEPFELYQLVYTTPFGFMKTPVATNKVYPIFNTTSNYTLVEKIDGIDLALDCYTPIIDDQGDLPDQLRNSLAQNIGLPDTVRLREFMKVFVDPSNDFSKNSYWTYIRNIAQGLLSEDTYTTGNTALLKLLMANRAIKAVTSYETNLQLCSWNVMASFGKALSKNVFI